MKKLILFYSISCLTVTSMVTADGGALGVQFGDVTFGLGGSSENGPIIGVGHSPDNGRSFSPVIVPGGDDDNCHKCHHHEHRRHHRRECNSCRNQNQVVEEIIVVE
jgi:hypothetical protein